MIRASVLLILVVISVATVAGFAAVNRGQGAGAASGHGAIGAALGGTGSVETGGHVAGAANVGHGSMFGGLFQFDDLQTEGEATGHLDAKGTVSSSFGSYGEGDVSGQGDDNEKFWW